MRDIGNDAQVQKKISGNGGLLGLPRELRDMIYRELLKVDHFQCLSTQRLHLHPAILGVCKQLHNETKEVLYGENCWIEIVTDRWTREEIDDVHETILNHPPFLGFPIARFGELPCPHMISLKIEIGEPVPSADEGLSKLMCSCTTKSAPRYHFVVCLAALPRFWMMINEHVALKDAIIVSITLGESVRKAWYDDLFFCLEDLQFYSEDLHLKVAGFKPSDTCARLADTIKSHIGSGDHVLNRISTYQSRAAEQSHKSRVREIYHDALDYLDCLLDGSYDSQYWSIDADEEQENEIQRIGMNLNFDFSKQCVELGDPSYAIYRVSASFRGWVKKEAQKQYKPDAQYHCALAQIAQGETNAAVFSLMQAIAATPGNKVYDAAIDQLEIELRRSTKAEDVMALSNIQEVLEPLRHQQLGPSVIVDDEMINGYPVGPKWVASAQEWKAIEKFQDVSMEALVLI